MILKWKLVQWGPLNFFSFKFNPIYFYHFQCGGLKNDEWIRRRLFMEFYVVMRHQFSFILCRSFRSVYVQTHCLSCGLPGGGSLCLHNPQKPAALAVFSREFWVSGESNLHIFFLQGVALLMNSAACCCEMGAMGCEHGALAVAQQPNKWNGSWRNTVFFKLIQL